MKKMPSPFCIALFLTVLFCLVHCKKEPTSLNIILYDKPLSVIQSYVRGSWKLEYAYGGITPIKYPARHNAYIILSDNKLVLGDDSTGVIVDTTLAWKREKDIFNDSTFLLTYSFSPGYPFPYQKVVDRIHNDTLILIDNASDPLYFYYIKN